MENSSSMAEKIANMNLDAHYTSNPKVVRPQVDVISGPVEVSKGHLYNDIDARNKFRQIDADIYDGVKAEKKKSSNGFWKVFLGVVLAILGFKGLQRLFHK